MSTMTGMCERRKSRRVDGRTLRRAGLALALWGLWGAALGAWRHDISNMLAGPIPLTHDVLCAVREPGNLPSTYVDLEASTVQRLFASAYSQGQEPYSYYGVVDLGDRRLLVHMPAGHVGSHFRGLIEPFTPFEKEHMLERLRAKDPDHELLPFRLNMTRPLWLTVAYFRVVPLVILLALAVWQSRWLPPLIAGRKWTSLSSPTG